MRNIREGKALNPRRRVRPPPAGPDSGRACDRASSSLCNVVSCCQFSVDEQSSKPYEKVRLPITASLEVLYTPRRTELGTNWPVGKRPRVGSGVVVGGQRREKKGARDKVSPQDKGGLLTHVLPSPAEKASVVRAMFDRIATRYDRLNRLFSFGLDQYWRRVTVRAVRVTAQDRVVDLACGTGDLSALAARTGARVVGVDFSGTMLAGARRRGIDALFVQADASFLPIPSQWATVVLSGFALRNFVSIPVVLAEAARVLAPGGRLALLEVDTPSGRILRWGHQVYFTRIVPWLGGLLSDAWAYTYLPQSVSYLPESAELQTMIEEAGFLQVGKRQLSGGVAQLLTAVRR